MSQSLGRDSSKRCAAACRANGSEHSTREPASKPGSAEAGRRASHHSTTEAIGRQGSMAPRKKAALSAGWSNVGRCGICLDCPADYRINSPWTNPRLLPGCTSLQWQASTSLPAGCARLIRCRMFRYEYTLDLLRFCHSVKCSSSLTSVNYPDRIQRRG